MSDSDFDSDEFQDATGGDEEKIISEIKNEVMEENAKDFIEGSGLSPGDIEELKEMTFGNASGNKFQVRGHNYLEDKVKIPSKDPIFECVSVSCYDSKKHIKHVASRSPTLKAKLASKDCPFLFIVTWLVPGPPPRTAVCLFKRVVPPKVDPKFDELFDKFLAGTDEERNERFKFIPCAIKSGFFVRSSLKTLGGMRPVIIGKKLKTEYFVGKNYLEVNIDISSSSIACMVCGLFLNALKNMVIDMAFLLEAGHDKDRGGKGKEELPERVIAGVRVMHCLFKKCCKKVDW